MGTKASMAVSWRMFERRGAEYDREGSDYREECKAC